MFSLFSGKNNTLGNNLGIAEWFCSCERHRFATPEPDRRNCREEWIGDIQQQVRIHKKERIFKLERSLKLESL